MSFAHASYAKTCRAALAVATTKTLTLGNLSSGPATGVVFVFKTVDRTQGTCTIVVEGSFNGVDYRPLGSDLIKVISADGLSYLVLTGAIPSDLQLTLTPATGFDGTVEIIARSSHQLSFTPVEV